jgi:hypothetical protein
MTRLNPGILFSLLAVGLLMILVNFAIPGNTFLTREINNAMHFPFFGVLTLLFLGLSSTLLNKVISDRWRHYLIALGTAVAVGILHEYSQIAGPRDADYRDLARDAAGAITFLALYMTCDKKISPIRGKWVRKIRALVYSGAVLIILIIILPSALWAGSYLHRDRNFPVICDFESFWENRFLKTQDAVLDITSGPHHIGKEKNSDKVGRLTFLVAEYPGLAIREPYPDWLGCNSLNFQAFSELNFPVEIGIRIEDSRHNNNFNDRFNRVLVINPGMNNISIPLEDIKNGPSAREIDLTHIRAIILFAHNPAEEFALYLDDFELN